VVILLPEINKQKLDVSSEGFEQRLLTLDEGPLLETSSFCLFISGSNITTQRWKTDDEGDHDGDDDNDHGG
jgi:hypothetical protein